MGGGGDGPSCKFKKAARKILVCGSFCYSLQTHVLDNSTDAHVSCNSSNYISRPENEKREICCKKISSENSGQGNSSESPSSHKSSCAICLDPLNCSSGSSPGQAIFTAQCSHAFHFTCISSNVRHGSVTCPICRAHWTQLPRDLKTGSLHYIKLDPVLQILDDSIANSRVNRRSFLRSARYDDDDPLEPEHANDIPRLRLSLLNGPPTNQNFSPCPHQASGSDSCCHCKISSHHSSGSSSVAESPPPAAAHLSSYMETSFLSSSNMRTYLRVNLAPQPARDLVLVASPNGPHLRLMRQAMASVIFSLRPIDRLAILTYSSAAARVFPLRRMTVYGKRTALQVIDRLFYMGQADPMEGLKKGVKILGDRVHQNPESCILHLTDTQSVSYHRFDMEVPVTIHRFHVGFVIGSSNGFIMREFEEFFARTIGGAIRDIQLRIGESTSIVRIGELRGIEERNIPLYLGDVGHVCVEYSYVDGGDGCERVRTGEIVVGMGDKGERSESVVEVVPIARRLSSGEGWEDYRDPFMARRWAKHLHCYRL